MAKINNSVLSTLFLNLGNRLGSEDCMVEFSGHGEVIKHIADLLKSEKVPMGDKGGGLSEDQRMERAENRFDCYSNILANLGQVSVKATGGRVLAVIQADSDLSDVMPGSEVNVIADLDLLAKVGKVIRNQTAKGRTFYTLPK
jgi:hypothetical protein